MLTIGTLRDVLSVEAQKQRAKDEDIDALFVTMSSSLAVISNHRHGLPSEVERQALIRLYCAARACIYWDEGDYDDGQGCSFADYVDTIGQSLDWTREMLSSYDLGGAIKEVGVIASIARGALEKFCTEPPSPQQPGSRQSPARNELN